MINLEMGDLDNFAEQLLGQWSKNDGSFYHSFIRFAQGSKLAFGKSKKI